MQTVKRKSAKSVKDIPDDIFAQLNEGAIETANLVEWLAIDQPLLVQNVLQQCDRKQYISPVLEAIAALKKPKVNTRSPIL
jgi:hypothetical protein